MDNKGPPSLTSGGLFAAPDLCSAIYTPGSNPFYGRIEIKLIPEN